MPLLINAEHLNADAVALLQQVGRLLDALPAHLGQMHQPFDAADVDERAEVCQVHDDAVKLRALLQGREQFGLTRLANFTRGGLLGEDQPVARPIDLDDLGQHRLADEGLVATLAILVIDVLQPVASQLRVGHKAAQLADTDQDAALVETDDLSFQGFLRFHQVAGHLPIALFGRPPERQDDVPVLIFRIRNEDEDFLAFL